MPISNSLLFQNFQRFILPKAPAKTPQPDKIKIDLTPGDTSSSSSNSPTNTDQVSKELAEIRKLLGGGSKPFKNFS